VLAGPVYLAMGGYYSMNPIDQTLWALAALLLLRIVNHEDPRLWLGFGAVLGLGLLNKLSVMWLGCGVLVGMLLTPQRRWLATPWPWFAGVLALAILTPYLVWQAQHGWPVVEFTRNAALDKNVPAPPLTFLGLQILALHPLTLPFWLLGPVYLLVAPEMKRYRILAWVWLTVFAILMASGSARTYYGAPALTFALAAAGRAVEALAARRRLRWLPALASALLTVALVTGAPLSIPLLPADHYAAYERALGLKPPPEAREVPDELPIHFALRFHAPALLAALGEAYESLSPAEREQVVILTDSFHEAGAVNVLGSDAGLPRAIGIHNHYWLWGPGDAVAELALVVAPPDSPLLAIFEHVERTAMIDCPRCMPFLQQKAVYRCRGLRHPLAEVWPELKQFR